MSTPKCCEGCDRLSKTGACFHYRSCGKWIKWFREQWHGIRKAAALATPNEVERDRKLLELQMQEEQRYAKKGWSKDDKGTTKDL